MTNITLYNSLKQKVQSIVKHLKLEEWVTKKTGRPLALSLVEVLTLGLFKQRAQIETKKELHELMEPACSYKTLVVNMNRFAFLGLLILQILMKVNRTVQQMIKHIDSSSVPVCLNKNGKHHKTMVEYAKWGKNGTGSFYGLKLHLIYDLSGLLMNMGLTAGNVDDRKMIMKLSKELWGYLVGDAGYYSKERMEEFYQEGKRLLIAKPKKNQKKLATPFDTWLYNTRWQIEFNFRNLKMFYGLVTSLPRSVVGYLGNYIYSILAYTIS
ncbi:MAG TPA: IS982 family transposase [Patescibacteria group bacterium]|nr:IS982 family transposase [Patescibacteria group bacterium]